MTFIPWDQAALDAMSSAAAVEPTSAGLVDVQELLRGCVLARLGDDALMAVRARKHAQGMQLDLAAFVSSSEQPQLFRAIAEFDQLCKKTGAVVGSFGTPHEAIAKLAQRRGYTLAGFILRKTFPEH